ncbi:MAG TPA: Cyclin D1-binding domain-containing protein [Pseudomonadales bacterium]
MSVLLRMRHGFIFCAVMLLSACAGHQVSSASTLPDLRGQWIGSYPCCGIETLEITQEGEQVQATKMTGDDFVPAGEVSWRANVESGSGEGQIAEKGFTNARFISGRLTVLDDNTLQFEWGDALTVIYSRLD